MRRPALAAMSALVLVACGLSLWRGLNADDTDLDAEDSTRLAARAADPGPPPTGQLPPPLPTDGFENLFVPGAPAQMDDGEKVTMAVLDAGSLDLPSGRLIACDPYVQSIDHEYQRPFVDTVAPGTYPVTLAVAEHHNGHQTVAAVRLTVRDEPVTEWRMALQAGEKLEDLGPDEFWGFGVDAGTGVFVDASALDALTRLAEDEEDPLAAAELADDDKVFWNMRDKQSGHNVVAFHSGFGDGAYPTWVGRTATGEIAQFVTDLLVVPPPPPPPDTP